MRELVFIIAGILLLNCCVRHSNKVEYKNTYTDQNKQLDLAKLEIYKLNGGNNCDCTAIVHVDRERKDTVSIFSLQVKTDTIVSYQDTTFYYFSFWAEGYLDVNSIFTPNKPFPECAFYYGVGYIGESETPFKALISESFYSLYGLDIDAKELDLTFKKCLYENRHVLNKWLEEYTKKKTIDKEK
ncbi:MAG: hypothetical protein KDC61_04360 [Saprospiraceae bacterium]|nr:hypothetical protein [Saprospiraceae bacterium]MCB0542427.1 hypothetical protein [Saprospiraceae bacterium]MCB0573783.1 hypothetical protein [Saprospiraceae bacterium]MCB9356853.1 hypothetical protein [Lewinellaceae bacterium]